MLHYTIRWCIVLPMPKTKSAMVEFRDAAAKRAFRKAWLARTDGEYSFDLAAVIQQDGTIFVHGTDDVECAADLANEILGVKVEIYEES